MVTFSKVVRYYLYLVSIFYFVIGLGAFLPLVEDMFPGNEILENIIGLALKSILEIPFMVGFFASLAGLTPKRFLQAPNLFTSGFPPAWVYLGVVAIVLSVISIIALTKVRHSLKWIYVWYALSSLAILQTIDNYLLTSGSGYFRWKPIILGFVNGVLILSAVYLVHRAAKRETPVVSWKK